jgi:hypothetical protein
VETIIQKRGFSIIASAGVRGLRGGCDHRSCGDQVTGPSVAKQAAFKGTATEVM